MAARLDKPLKRELVIDGEAYTLTLSPEGLKLVPKGKRKGHELSWKAIVTGEVETTQALESSLRAAEAAEDRDGPPRPRGPKLVH
jgi:hypothetical protein